MSTTVHTFIPDNIYREETESSKQEVYTVILPPKYVLECS